MRLCHVGSVRQGLTVGVFRLALSLLPRQNGRQIPVSYFLEKEERKQPIMIQLFYKNKQKRTAVEIIAHVLLVIRLVSLRYGGVSVGSTAIRVVQKIGKKKQMPGSN